MYLAHTTRPDICFRACKLGSYLSKPTLAHWEAAKRVLRYLASVPSLSLSYSSSGNKQLIAYCDSDGELLTIMSENQFQVMLVY